jgi:hypothetical protein
MKHLSSEVDVCPEPIRCCDNDHEVNKPVNMNIEGERRKKVFSSNLNTNREQIEKLKLSRVNNVKCDLIQFLCSIMQSLASNICQQLSMHRKLYQ